MWRANRGVAGRIDGVSTVEGHEMKGSGGKLTRGCDGLTERGGGGLIGGGLTSYN